MRGATVVSENVVALAPSAASWTGLEKLARPARSTITLVSLLAFSV